MLFLASLQGCSIVQTLGYHSHGKHHKWHSHGQTKKCLWLLVWNWLLACFFLLGVYSWMLAQTSFLELLGLRAVSLRPLLGVSDSELSSTLWVSFSQMFYIRINSCICSVCAETLTTCSPASSSFLYRVPLKNQFYHLTAFCSIRAVPFLKLAELSAKIQMSARILWWLNIYKLYFRLTHCYIKNLLFIYLDLYIFIMT